MGRVTVTLHRKSLGAMLLVVPLLLGLAACSSTPDTIPNVVGQSTTKAEATLQADSIPFTTTIDAENTTSKRDSVISQSPAAGAANTGQIVVLHIRS
jgi:beta-lactam-binding protein with PASTA domain